MQGGIYHLAGDEGEQGLHHALQYAPADEILADVYRDAASGYEVAFDRPDVLALFRGEEGQVHFRYDGETAVDVNYPYECLDAAGLVYMAPDAP